MFRALCCCLDDDDDVADDAPRERAANDRRRRDRDARVGALADENRVGTTTTADGSLRAMILDGNDDGDGDTDDEDAEWNDHWRGVLERAEHEKRELHAEATGVREKLQEAVVARLFWLCALLGSSARYAPVGEAFREVHEACAGSHLEPEGDPRTLFSRLYAPDGHHPSRLCLLYTSPSPRD